MTIVRVGHRNTAMTEGFREFWSVLETVSAGGVIIPPFNVWQGKTHRESDYQKGGVEHEATFAIFPSGYMGGELRLEYIQQLLNTGNDATGVTDIARVTENAGDTELHGIRTYMG